MAQLPSAFMRQPPFGATPAATPSASPGASVAALSQVRKAIEILQMALPNLPIGSPQHEATASAIKSLSKHVSSNQTDQAIGQTTLTDLQQKQQQEAPMMALMRAQGGMQQPQAQPQPQAAAA